MTWFPLAPKALLVLAGLVVSPAGATAPEPGSVTAVALPHAVRDTHPLDAAAAEDPTTTGVIEVSRRAEAEGDADRALLYAKLAVALAVDGKEEKSARARWIEVRKSVAAPEPDPTGALADSAKVLLGVAASCESRKLYANAADVLNLLKGTAYDRDARAKLAKLFANPKAIEGLLDSGVAVEFKGRERLSKKEIAKLNAKHSEWSDPLVLEGENYVMKTDMPYEMGRAMLDAMEQINKFYRKVFKLGRGDKTRKCIIHVYKNRAEFDEHAQPGGPGVQGYYRRDTNEVHTFDHGTVDWLGREFLWSTLFHEASHQFTAEIWKLLIPTWLNEGTGSYFEGAELQPGGFVATNRIPDGRLRELIMYIGRRAKEGESGTDVQERGPSLKDVISYFQPGSYPGEYYPFGWGLVFFCRNYEDANSKRVYLPIYEAFMRSYVKGSGERNPFKRFEDYFITDAKIPGIDTFADFERIWKAWIRDLADIQYGGQEKADVLIARGLKQRADGAPADYAVDTFRWATEKNPNHATAWLELGRSAAEAKQKDAALYAFRRLAALAQRRVEAGAPLPFFKGTANDAYSAALAEIKGLDSSIERSLRENVDQIVASSLEAAEAHSSIGFPITALSLLRDADQLLDGEGRIRTQIQALSAKTGVDGRLMRRVPVDEELSAWTTEDSGWKVGDGGSLKLEGGRGISTIRLTEPPAKVFRFEAKVKKTSAMVGLLFDGQQLDESYALVEQGARCILVQFDSDMEAAKERKSPFVTLANFADSAPPKSAESFTLAIDVEHTQLRVFVDGELVGTYEVPCEELIGQIGLVVQGKSAEFESVHIAY
ncbi:MAG: hypothetical protein R3F49_17745 [Planctomycetota bacterium]